MQDEQNIMERGRLCLAGYNQTNHKEEYQKGYVSANDIQKEMDLKNNKSFSLISMSNRKRRCIAWRRYLWIKESI